MSQTEIEVKESCIKCCRPFKPEQLEAGVCIFCEPTTWVDEKKEVSNG